MTMTPYLTRYYPLGARRPHTEVMHVDHLGHHVPLLDENGEPVNFERKPQAAERAIKAMEKMGKLFNGE